MDGIMGFKAREIWLLLVANVALVILRIVVGRNFLILLWLPLEAQYHLMPIDLVNEIISS